MKYHPRSGRYQVSNSTDKHDPDHQLLRFPSEKTILELWEEHFPGILFSLGSSIENPVTGFWVDVGGGTQLKKRQDFCDELLELCEVEDQKLKTGAEWNLLFSESIVTDPDGWRGKGISFNDDRITIEEYLRLRKGSTVQILNL